MGTNCYQLFDEQKRLILGNSNLFYSNLSLEDFAKTAKKVIPNYSNFKRSYYVGKFIKIEFGFNDLKYIDHKLIKL